MTQAYAPGLKVARRTVHRSRRLLPVPGEVLTQVGQVVRAQDVVAQAFMPGDVIPVNLSHLLGVAPSEVPRCMLKHVGEPVAVGDPLARSPGVFGWLAREAEATAEGTVETVSQITGQVLLRGAPHPVRVLAYLAGTVVEVLPRLGAVIESPVSMIQGIFGVGGETFGPLRLACDAPSQNLTQFRLSTEMRGAVVVGGARVTAEAIRRAIEFGVAALVTGGIDDADLRDFLGYDLGVAVTGHEKIGLTLIITEGFGDIAMAQRTYELLRLREGAAAAVNGATQIRAGVLRPEVVVPWTNDAPPETGRAASPAGLLTPGVSVRIIRDPYFGLIGTVSAMPPEPRTLASGSRARVLTVRLPDEREVSVPRANVELIED